MTTQPIRILVLGSGTCFPAKGKPRRAHPLFYIDWGNAQDEHLLLECSANAAERLEAAGIAPDSIRHVAVSHAHPDHFALPQFAQSVHCAGMLRDGFSWEDTEKHPSLIFIGPSHIAESIPMLNAIHFEESPRGLSFPKMTPCALCNGEEADLPFGVGSATLHAFRAEHGFGKVDALAYRLKIDTKVIAYSGDTGMCDGVIEAARNADVFICEASSRVGNEKGGQHGGYGHLSPRQAGEIAKQAGAKVLVLTHYSGFDSEEAMMADCYASGFEGSLAIAEDNMKIELINGGIAFNG